MKNIKCPICEFSTESFLNRSNVVVHQNLLYSNRKKSLQARRGNLNLLTCHNCGFVFNHAFDLTKLQYGKNYDNSQDFSPFFANYISRLANNLLSKKGLKDCLIVEIGCGKGVFLKKLVLKKEWNNIGYGFDPTYNGPLTDLDGRLNFKRNFYDNKHSDFHPDIVISRHVIEHIPNPKNFLKMIFLKIKIHFFNCIF